MTEDSEESAFCTYARIDSTEMSIPRDLTDYWEDPASYFLISGELRGFCIREVHCESMHVVCGRASWVRMGLGWVGQG